MREDRNNWLNCTPNPVKGTFMASKKALLTGLGVFVFILLNGNAFAQRDSTDSVIPTLGDASARWVVKIAPLFLLDPENTVQFGVERTFGGRSSVQVEGGYGWPGFRYSQDYTYTNREVWRGRAEWRIYNRINVRPRGSYFAIEGFYKQVNAIENGTIGRACTGSFNCQYFQQYRSTTQKFVAGGHLKWGKQFRLDDNWLFDFYFGIGLRSVMHQNFRPQFADSYSYRYSDGLFSWVSLGGTDAPVAPSATIGFKIGYVIR